MKERKWRPPREMMMMAAAAWVFPLGLLFQPPTPSALPPPSFLPFRPLDPTQWTTLAGVGATRCRQSFVVIVSRLRRHCLLQSAATWTLPGRYLNIDGMRWKCKGNAN